MAIAGVSLLALPDWSCSKYLRKDIINKEGDKDRACLRADTLREGALGDLAARRGERAYVLGGGEEGQC